LHDDGGQRQYSHADQHLEVPPCSENMPGR
jgi:hypothetical protein